MVASTLIDPPTHSVYISTVPRRHIRSLNYTTLNPPMERSSQRQWDPVAPSLLWAHELRREHVHLAEQLDNTRTDLTSTTTTVTDLAKKIDDVDHQIQGVQTRCEQGDSLRKVAMDELEGCIQRVIGRFEALETEHAQLKRRVELFETGYADRVDDWTQRFGDIEMRLPSTRQGRLPAFAFCWV